VHWLTCPPLLDFYVGGAQGNCGWWSNDGQLVLAIAKSLYDRNGGSNCGQYVKITATVNGQKKTAWGKTVGLFSLTESYSTWLTIISSG
jgi:hypothetical protein